MGREKICFECKAKDGLQVRLTKERYDEHVLGEHPELERDFAYPVSEIQNALENAESVTPGNRAQTVLYLGPIVTPNGVGAGFGFANAKRQFRVAVKKEDAQKGLVLTAYAPIVVR